MLSLSICVPSFSSGFPPFGKKVITGGMQSSSHVISPLALTGDGRHFGRRGTTEAPAARAAPSPDGGGSDDIDEVARRGPNDACGAGADIRRSLAQGG